MCCMAFNTNGSLTGVGGGQEREKCSRAEIGDHGDDGPAAF